MRKLLTDEVEFKIECLEEDTSPTDACHGYDLDVAQALFEAGENSPWGWCLVRVQATWCGIQGDAYLGGSSFADEDAFIASDYYEQIREEALAALNAAVVKHISDSDDMRNLLS